MQFHDRNDISMLKGLFWKLLSVRLTIMSVTRSAYPITKCLLSCDVLLMLIGSRQYTVLFPLKY